MTNQHQNNNDEIETDYYEDWEDYSEYIPTSDELWEEIIITDKNIENNSSELLKGIFLYTDSDREIVNYIRDNFQEFYKLTGDWSKIYIL